MKKLISKYLLVVSDFFLYTCKLYLIKETYRNIKGVPRRALATLKWLPAIYRFNNWDYTFILDMWSEALKHQIYFYSKKENVGMCESRRKRIVKKMSELKQIFDNLNNQHEAYVVAGYKELESPVVEFVDIPGEDCSKIEFKFKSKQHEKIWHKLHKKQYKYEAKRATQDLRKISKILEKHLFEWWD